MCDLLLISPVTLLRQLSALLFAKYNGTTLVFVFRIHVPLLVFWSIRSIAQICNIIPPKFSLLSLIYCYITFRAFNNNVFNPVVSILA
jgi:hypothetical protein